MLKAAITGNIAAGKSQVEKILSDKGFLVYDTDKIAHRYLDELETFYDYDVFSQGKIDRKKMAKLVFNNPDLKMKLEEIIHPKVRQEILNIFEQNTNQKIVFVSVPLLFETGFDVLFDKIILVTASEKTRLERLMKRNNLTKEEAVIRIKSQISENEKKEKSDFVINNDSDLANLKEQTEKCLTNIFRTIS